MDKKLVVVDANRLMPMIEALVDNSMNTKRELKQINETLKDIDKRQKKDNRVGLFVTICIFAGTIYATAYLEIINKERLRDLLNFAFDSIVQVS